MGQRALAIRAVLRLAWRTAGWVAALGVAAVVLVAVVVPRVGGGTPYVVLTGSMRPAMPPGTLVVVRPVAAADVRVGDVITYQLRPGRPEVVTHRVVAQGVDAHGRPVYRTRGDANPAPDPSWVRPVQVRGARWYAVPYVGRLVTLIGISQHRLLDVVAAVALMGYGSGLLVVAWWERRRGARTGGVAARHA